MRYYWKLRWALWNWREALTAELVLLYLRRHSTVYVHDRKGFARAVIVREELAPEAVYDLEPHSHIEARP